MLDMIEEAQKIPGFPTLEEFLANPERWQNKPERIFEFVDAGSQSAYRNIIEKQEYYYETYKVDSLEKLQSIIRDEGLDPDRDVDVEGHWQHGRWPGKYVVRWIYKKKKLGLLVNIDGSPLV